MQNEIFCQLPLDRQVVLLRVLRPQVGLKLTVKQDRPENRPVNRIARLGLQDPVKGVGKLETILAVERRLDECRIDQRAPAEGGLRAELLQNQLLDRIVEDSESSTYAGRSVLGRIPCNADARSKGLVVSRCQAGGDTFIPGYDEPSWKDGIARSVWTAVCAHWV